MIHVNKRVAFTFWAYMRICTQYMIYNFVFYHCLGTLSHFKHFRKSPVQVLLIHKPSESHTRKEGNVNYLTNKIKSFKNTQKCDSFEWEAVGLISDINRFIIRRPPYREWESTSRRVGFHHVLGHAQEHSVNKRKSPQKKPTVYY